MNIEEFIYSCDLKLSKKLDDDFASNEYSDADARVATVSTRIDVGVGLAIAAYNSKLLRSINIGIWGIFSLLIVNLIIRLV
ncbi:hypothetical protein KAT72_18790 [Aeromonas popoffii]|uniref:Uncharacterized protein n=1 Tax=Aeromonas popoffii TaxID=70856 RepID=A0ABS5GX73_9GAMM|nr:hypothetical protein [Aeromonas popoffii]MBR7631009.1 hypothetical protein [Aeromonas popoffii]